VADSYAFDPGARGKLPVERFKEAAEKYGWILAGSNNSRNGPLQPSAEAWRALWQDTHDRFAIDQIIANKAFDSLRNEPQYQQIIQSLKSPR
jgi:hypothetical protein